MFDLGFIRGQGLVAPTYLVLQRHVHFSIKYHDSYRENEPAPQHQGETVPEEMQRDYYQETGDEVGPMYPSF